MSEHLDGLNLVELLDLLEPAPEPPPISMMPQTAGWFWLVLGMAALTGWMVFAIAKRRRASAYRRAGLRALQAAGDDPAQIASIVRRTALAGFPRAEVAGLIGDDWLKFLDSTMKGTGFSDGPGRAIASAPYQAAADVPGLGKLARDWITTHQGTSLSRGNPK